MTTTTTDPLNGLLAIRDGFSIARWNFPDGVGSFASSPNGIGNAAALTYSFLSSIPSYYSLTTIAGFVPFSALQQQATKEVLASIANVTHLSFTEATGVVGTITFAMNTQLASNSGYAYYPTFNYTSTFTSSTADATITSVTEQPLAGDVWLNSNLNQFVLGGKGYSTLVHEIGHALGLKHSFEAASATGYILDASLDNTKYTVMSYTPHPYALYRTVIQTSSGYSFNYENIYPETLMPFDIAALQYLYGSNTSFNTGNDTYTFDSLRPFIKTIWDGGGNDTISVANFTLGCVIDLREDAYSSIRIPSNPIPSNVTYTDPHTNLYDGTDNLAIATGTIIENAIGGSGNDTLIGNSVDNSLNGGGGNNILDGGAGIDTAIYGAWSTYTVTGNVTSATITALTGTDGTDTLSNIENLTFNGVTVTIADAVNDAPVSVSDNNASDAVIETGTNVVGDSSAVGNVLSNDTDADSALGLGETKMVKTINGLSTNVGNAVVGVYGNLLLLANGSYTYTLDNANTTTNALSTGQVVTDTFTYTVVDAHGTLSTSTTLTINISGSNDTITNTAPTNLAISASSINENVVANSVIGTLSSTDPDVNNTFIYSLVTGTGSTDNSAFSIVGNQLTINSSPNFETKASYSVLVRTTDQGSLFFDKSLTIGINNLNELIIGTPNADTFIGTVDNDTIDGLAGADTIVFSGTLANASITYSASSNTFTVNSPDSGVDTISAVEIFQFADQSVAAYSTIPSSNFDADFYQAKYADVRAAFGTNKAAATEHYVLHGYGEGRTVSNAGNDTLNGSAINDTLNAGAGNDTINGSGGNDAINGGTGSDTAIFTGTRANASINYSSSSNIFTITTTSGGVDTVSNVETFQFSDQSIAAATAVSANSFNALGYIASHGDLIAVLGTNTAAATQHYIEHGYDEGRTISFNAQAYIAGYGDLSAAFGTNTAAATRHYITNGYNEHRSANVLGYIASYGDLITAFGTNTAAAAQHYTLTGYKEGRTISFDALGYVASNTDLITTFGTNTVAATKHFITLGHNERRATGFDVSFYLAKYADLRNAFNNDQDAAKTHFITTGYAEHRSASNAGDDTLNGSIFADNLNAGTGNDTINGKAGNDILDGGEGINTLTGGAGADVFKFTNLTGLDTITDFQVVDDTIQLENAVFTSLTTGILDAANFVIGTAANDVNDYLIYNNGTGALFYDVDGNGAGAAVQIALLGSSLALTNADFVVI